MCKIFNRASSCRGIRSRTHSAYHADAGQYAQEPARQLPGHRKAVIPERSAEAIEAGALPGMNKYRTTAGG